MFQLIEKMSTLRFELGTFWHKLPMLCQYFTQLENFGIPVLKLLQVEPVELAE